MNRLRSALGSVALLVPLVLLLAGAMVLCIIPASDYVTNRSVSVTDNFYLLGGIMALLMISSLFELLLVVRLIWGAAAVQSTEAQAKADPDEIEMRSMKVTGTKKAFIFVLLVGANTFGFDQLGHGMIVTDTRAIHALTKLRSTDGQTRADAVTDAIALTGDARIAVALGRVMDAPGDSREWAAYAAGVRHDVELIPTLARLLASGNPRERAAAAVALARLEDPGLVPLVVEAYPHAGELKKDLVIALGMLGKKSIKSEAALKMAGDFLAARLTGENLGKEHASVVLWALGQMEAPEGLAALESLVFEANADLGTQCIGLQALGLIGAADTSPKIVDMIYQVDREAYCPEIVTTDFTGHQVLLCEGMNLVQRLMHEIANIGDRRARPAMVKLAEDTSFSKQVRGSAGEIAFQMKYAKVP